MLVANYPDHGFVIDRKEAKKLSKNVEKPDESAKLLYELVRTIVPQKQSIYDLFLVKSPPLVEDLRREQSKRKKDSDESQPSQENVQSSQPSQKTQRSGKSSQPS